MLLLLHNTPFHPLCEQLNAFDEQFTVEYLPPNATAMIQLMDQEVIEKIKRIYEKQVLWHLFLPETEEESLIKFSTDLNLQDSCYMLADA